MEPAHCAERNRTAISLSGVGAISHAAAARGKAVGKLVVEFKTLKEEVSKSLNTLATQFDSKMNTISQKIDSIEAVQGELFWKVEAISVHNTEITAKVKTITRPWRITGGKC